MEKEPDSSQQFPVPGQEAVDTNWSTRHLFKHKNFKNYNLFYYKGDWTVEEVAQSVLESASVEIFKSWLDTVLRNLPVQEIGLGDLQQPLPTSAILWA